jgi:hypothetical protein
MGRVKELNSFLPAPFDGFAAHIGIDLLPRWCNGLAALAGRDVPERKPILKMN